MTKILLPDLNSTWGVRVRPQATNVYQYAYSFDNLTDKIEFVEEVLLNGKKLQNELDKQLNKSFTRTNPLKAEFRIDKSKYPGKTDEFFLGKDICIVQKDGELFFYAILEIEKLNNNEFLYIVELDIFFTYGEKNFFNNTEAMVKKAHDNRWKLSLIYETIIPDIDIAKPIANSEGFTGMGTQVIDKQDLELINIERAIENTDDDEIESCKRLIKQLQWKVCFLSKTAPAVSGETASTTLSGSNYFVYAIPFIQREKDLKISGEQGGSPFGGIHDPRNGAVFYPTKLSIKQENIAVDLHYASIKVDGLNEFSSYIVQSTTTLYPGMPFTWYDNLTSFYNGLGPKVFSFKYIKATDDVDEYLQVSASSNPANTGEQNSWYGPFINFVPFDYTDETGLKPVKKSVLLPNIVSWGVSAFTTFTDAIGSYSQTKFNILGSFKPPKSQYDEKSINTEVKLLTAPYTTFTLATAHTSYDYNFLFLFEKNVNVFSNFTTIYFQQIYNMKIKSRSISYVPKIVPQIDNDFSGPDNYYSAGVIRTKNFNDSTPIYLPSYTKAQTNYLIANSNQLQVKKQKSGFEALAGVVAGGIALALAPETGGLSLVAAGGLLLGAGGAMANSHFTKQSINAQIKDEGNIPNEITPTEIDIDILTKMGNWLPTLYVKTLFEIDKISIENSFYKFGYTWNKLSKLNNELLKSRYWFNYVELEGCFENISLQVSNEVKNIINESFSYGITLYHVRRNKKDNKLDYLSVKDFSKENMEMSLLNSVKNKKVINE